MKTFIVLTFFAVAALAIPPYGRNIPSVGYETPYPTTRSYEHGHRFQQPQPEQLKPHGEEYVRICVPSSCEMKKCQRLASELTYKVEPRKEWSCIQATSQEHCLQWVKEGHADVVVVRDDDVHKAVRKYNLKPLAHEVPSIKDSLKDTEAYDKVQKYEKISLAVVHKDSRIGRVTDLKGIPSCHAGVHHPASFKVPVCSLIEEGHIPKTGNHIESAADFFKRSCVPGILDPRVDRNGTNPVQLIEICGSEGQQKGSFSDKYSDNKGASECLTERKGQVAFIDHTYIEEFIEKYGSEVYQLVCKEGVHNLRDWSRRTDCHLGHKPQPTIFTRKDKVARWHAITRYLEKYGQSSEHLMPETTPTPEHTSEFKQREQDYDNTVVEILQKAVTKFQQQEHFKLFSSDEYKCDEHKVRQERKRQTLKKFEEIFGVQVTRRIEDEEHQQHEAIEQEESKRQGPRHDILRRRQDTSRYEDEEYRPREENRGRRLEQPRRYHQETQRQNLIFLDTSSGFEKIGEEKIERYFEEYMRSSDKCDKLQGKPHAKFCVTSEKEYEKCLKMKEYFSKVDKVKDVAWGCERAHSKLECMKKVYEGKADLISLKPDETFIAGRELLLQPILSEFHEVFDREIEGKKHYDDESKTTKTYTVGIIKKDRYQELFNKDKHIDGRQDWENKSINLKNLKTCLAGISKISGFKHPIGHLMANGTIPRIGSIFESVHKHFERTCLPGAKHFTVEKDLILGHEFNWGHNTTQFANFTGHDFFTWNSPYTWSYYDLQKRTPQFLENFFKLPELLRRLENMDLPEELKQKIEHIREGRERELLGQPKPESYTPYTEAEEQDDVIKSLIEDLRKVHESSLGEWEKDEETRRIKKQIQKRLHEKRQESWYEALLGNNPVEYQKIEKFMKEHDLSSLQHIKMTLQAAIPHHLKKAVPELSHLFKIIPETKLDETEKTYLKHPAVQHFLQVYYPTLVKQLLKVVGDEFQHDEHNRYTSPIWLSPEYKEFLTKMKLHGEKLSESCEGSGTEDKESERFYDYVGVLKCLEEKKGDITFLPSHKLQEFRRHFHPEIQHRQPEDYALICPCGKVVPYVNTKSIKECNFGRVPYNAIVTDSKRTGTYRWTVTKALLHAQRVFAHQSSNEYDFKMFGEDSVFDKETTKLHPVPLVNQTFEVHLGPQLIRSLEALVKPSSTHIFKEHKQLCYGQQFSNVIYQHNETCRAVVKTVTCTGEPRNKTIHLNRLGEKISINVEMISRPTRYSRKLVEFTCDTGYSYLKPVVIPQDCECVPKDEIAYSPKWNHDSIWYEEERKYQPTRQEEEEDEQLHKKLWGNKQQWVERKQTPNFFQEPETREEYLRHHPHGQRVVQYNRHQFDTPHYWKKTVQVCEKRHHFNNTFQPERQDLTRPVCPRDYEEHHHHHSHHHEQVYQIEKHNEQIYKQEVEEQKYEIRHQEKTHQEEEEVKSLFPSWWFF